MSTDLSKNFPELARGVSGINNWRNYRGKQFTVKQLKAWRKRVNWPLVFEFKCWEPSVEFFTEFKDLIEWSNPDIYKRKLHRTILQNFNKRINWKELVINYKLTDDIISEFGDELDWNLVSKHQKVSDKTMRQFADKVNWNEIIESRGNMKKKGRTITQKMLKDQGKANRLDWSLVCQHQYISFDLMKEFEDKMDWDKVSRNQPLDELRFFDQWADKLNWHCICKLHKELPSEVFRKHFDKIDWKTWLTEDVKYYNRPVIPAGILEEMADKFDWKLLSQYYAFKSDEIIKFHDRIDINKLLKSAVGHGFTSKLLEDPLFEEKVDWNFALKYKSLTPMTLLKIGHKISWKKAKWTPYQEFTKEVLIKFADKVDWHQEVFYRSNECAEILDQFADKVNWSMVSRFMKLSQKTIRKYADHVIWKNISSSQCMDEAFINEFRKKLDIGLVKRNPYIPWSVQRKL